MSPDEAEKAQLEANIKMALQRDQIGLEDAIDIREIKNIKLANQLLKLKKKRREEAQQAYEQQKQQSQGQIQMQSQQMAAQTSLQNIQAEAQAKMQVKQAETQYEIEKMKQEAELKYHLMEVEFQMNMQLKGLDVKNMQMKDTLKEQAKDERVTLQNTQQSKLIEQRKNNLPPIDFESENDSLDGFDLAQFSPR
jgi:hypothetical protein